MVSFERREDTEFSTTIIARLKDGRNAPQAKLVSTLSGQCVSVNVILLSMVSEPMSSVLRDVLSNTADIVKVIVPVEIEVLRNLVKFIGKGCAYFHSEAEIVAVGQAAELLGISTANWEVKAGVTPDENKIDKTDKASRIQKEYHYDCKLCQITFRRKYSFARHQVKVHGSTSTVATFSCETCKKTFYRKHYLNNHKLSKKHKELLLLHSSSPKGEFNSTDEFSPTHLTNALKKKVPKLLPMKKKVKLNKACKLPVSGYKKRKFVGGKWVCTICDVSFASYFKLNAHLDTIHNVKVSKDTCNVCEYTSYCKKIMRRHKKTKRHLKRCAEWTESKKADGQAGQDLVLYSCDQCHVTFLSLKRYNRHLKSKKHKRLQNQEVDEAKPDNNNTVEHYDIKNGRGSV